MSSFQPKFGGGPKERRQISIADESGLAIQVTLWGGNATKLDYREGEVLAIRGAKVSDYGGKTLNSGNEHSQIYLNIDDKRTRELLQWHKNRNSSSAGINSISTINTSGHQEN